MGRKSAVTATDRRRDKARLGGSGWKQDRSKVVRAQGYDSSTILVLNLAVCHINAASCKQPAKG